MASGAARLGSASGRAAVPEQAAAGCPGQRVGGQDHRRRRPAAALGGKVGLVRELPAGPVGAVGVPQVLDVGGSCPARPRSPFASSASTSSHVSAPVTQGWSLTQRRRGRGPRSRPTARPAGPPRPLRAPPRRGPGSTSPSRTGSCRRTPPGGDNHVPQLAGRESQSGCGCPTSPPAPPRSAGSGRCWSSRSAARSGPGCRRPRAPGDLAARRLQGQHVADRAAHRRPHPRRERRIAGDQKLVPDADRDVGDLVALVAASVTTAGVLFGHDPSARWLARSQS